MHWSWHQSLYLRQCRESKSKSPCMLNTQLFSLSTYTNWPLGSCAIYGQSYQIVIEDTVAWFACTECKYTRYWHVGSFELVWYHATKIECPCDLIVPQARVKVKAGVGLPASVLIVGDEEFAVWLVRNMKIKSYKHNWYVRITQCAEKLPHPGIIRGEGLVTLSWFHAFHWCYITS